MTNYQLGWLAIYTNIVGMQHHPGKKERLTYSQCAMEAHLATKHWEKICQSSVQDYSSQGPWEDSQATHSATQEDKAQTPPTNK